MNNNDVLDILKSVHVSNFNSNIVDLDYVKNLKIMDANVFFDLEIPVALRQKRDELKQECTDKILAHSQAKSVHINVRFQVAKVISETKTSSHPNATKLKGVKRIIAIASGKGGVGKSTVTSNLAMALAHNGAKVGVMDVDIYGPSQSMMFGITGSPKIDENRNLIPIEAYGVKVVSMAMLSDGDSAVIWRGPMVSQMVNNFLFNVHWGELDYLLIDMPPGTGDIQLTLTQSAPLSGAIIVTTPQDVCLADAKKGLKMFQKVSVPILGIIENMSYFICDACDKRHNIFQEGGGLRIANQLGVPFYGEIPLMSAVSKCSDKGKPIVLEDVNSPISKAYLKIAEEMQEQLDLESTSSDLGTYNYDWELLEVM